VCALALVHTAVAGRDSPVWVAVGIAVFVAVSRDERSLADAIVLWLTPVAFIFANVVLTDDTQFGEVMDIVWLGVAAAAGEAVRNRRRYVREVEARAKYAEETRELEAQRRVAEERLRIARDLHDAMAHQVAVISVHAGVASHLLDTQPAQAQHALGHVRAAAGSVLDEMKTIVEMLRGAEGRELPLLPAPSLGQLSSLVEPFQHAGLCVEQTLVGELCDLPAAIDAAACSTIQEALTNVYKHAPGATANLLVERTRACLRIEVDNATATAEEPAPGTHTGLVGLRERIASVEGSLRAGRQSDGQYQLLAVIPIQEQRP
jgi:signal transduction histidine kinase